MQISSHQSSLYNFASDTNSQEAQNNMKHDYLKTTLSSPINRNDNKFKVVISGEGDMTVRGI